MVAGYTVSAATLNLFIVFRLNGDVLIPMKFMRILLYLGTLVRDALNAAAADGEFSIY